MSINHHHVPRAPPPPPPPVVITITECANSSKKSRLGTKRSGPPHLLHPLSPSPRAILILPHPPIRPPTIATTLPRLNKDITYYTKELTQWNTTLAAAETSEDTRYNLTKQVAENERTIESIQLQMTTFLDQLEDNMTKFLALNGELHAGDKAVVAQSASYGAAVELLKVLEAQYGLTVKKELLEAVVE